MHLSAALAVTLSNVLGLNYIFGKMTSHLTHVTCCLLQEILMICLTTAVTAKLILVGYKSASRFTL